MSKLCQEKAPDRPKSACGRPAMARWEDRWVCYHCLDRLEDAQKKGPPRGTKPARR